MSPPVGRFSGHTGKNRLHLDITVSDGRANPIETRRRLVDAETRRLEALGATLVRALFEDGLDHYGIAMRDPEGNEFDINLRSLARRSRRGVRMRYPPYCANRPIAGLVPGGADPGVLVAWI